MTPLSLEYEDKYHLWSALVRGAADRIFVPTEDPPPIGTEVPLRVAVPRQGVQTVLRAQVVGRRRPGTRFPGGSYLHLSHGDLDACRTLLGLTQPNGPDAKGRRWPRVYRTLELTFKKPEVRGRCAAQNLSEAGMLVTCPAALFAGQRVEVALTLDNGEELPLSAEVVWVKPAEELAGLRFVNPGPDSSEQIAQALKRMLQATPRRTLHVVVVADTDKASLSLLQEVLAPFRAESFHVRNGGDVLSLTQWLRPSLIILDALLPGLDAVEVCRRMHADADLAETPVLFFSHLEEARLRALSDEAGATDYLPKPATREALSRAVEPYLQDATSPEGTSG